MSSPNDSDSMSEYSDAPESPAPAPTKRQPPASQRSRGSGASTNASYSAASRINSRDRRVQDKEEVEEGEEVDGDEEMGGGDVSAGTPTNPEPNAMQTMEDANSSEAQAGATGEAGVEAAFGGMVGGLGMGHPPNQPVKRLVISKMVLVNFKSYAGRVEIGPFHKSFTSIVGPNGSGKSNVIDSLLFVFGFKAKKMRQGKLSDLIHNSGKYQGLGFCRVEVHFREIVDLPGPDAFEIVPDSDLIISRTVEKTDKDKDKSTYRINGRTSSFTEVTGLLREKGVDLDHKRFLILQGEVESISQMKPKAPNEHEDGLLEYLEDIIGTSKYKEDIESASKRMEELNEERVMKLGIVGVVEKEKEGLR
ncbi:Structural maintenance of chromosomes protein 4, partial [Quaeritorhiza haematococci]